jgi:hypothetical protein
MKLHIFSSCISYCIKAVAVHDSSLKDSVTVIYAVGGKDASFSIVILG